MIEVNIIDYVLPSLGYFRANQGFTMILAQLTAWEAKAPKAPILRMIVLFDSILTTYIEVNITVILMNMFVQSVHEDGLGLGLNKYLKNPMHFNAEVSLVWQPYHIHLVWSGEYSCQTKITDIKLSKWQSDNFCGKTCLVFFENC